MFIVKYLTKFRFLLYVGFIICVTLVTWNPYWYNFFLSYETRTVSSDINYTNDEYTPREYNSQSDIRISEIYPNCGLKRQCPDDSFPVHIYTGQDKNDRPKLCVQGKYLGGGGRGLNIAVVEARYLQLVTLQTFDLYSQNSSSLELWLSTSLREDDIIIAFTFDEASRELSKRAKTILYHLGSGRIQDLRYRSQWYMISQKGIDGGFTPLETITYARADRWGKVIDERLCVPRKIIPLVISPDYPLHNNPARERLCSSFTELQCEDFCQPAKRHEPIVSSLLTNRSLIGNIVFSTPMVVVAGRSLKTLVLTLESIVAQPGIQSSSVLVFYSDKKSSYLVPPLVGVFGFRSVPVNISNKTGPNAVLFQGLRYVKNNFSRKKYVMVLEEGLLLSPDYLFYMAQMASVMEMDDTILAVSAWNPHGYKGCSGDVHLAYRAEDFPGLGTLLRMDMVTRHMLNEADDCCSAPFYKGWPQILRRYKDGAIIIPDVSRVLRRPSDLTSISAGDLGIFRTARSTNKEADAWIERPHELTKGTFRSWQGSSNHPLLSILPMMISSYVRMVVT
ncbi:protein O-linked-mannose beta-1,2-N-acetylglucosaminyltransferase 1-like isoform X2 [Rhodnius prolixus]|uniref:protein O-linked-mannose beta-1,2-N-acetylglucosaminyltransferase 1-like isoform X2 n=1 Tax=Rhodnius prolixus TaxID=13249 RepID=UPI003D187891